MPRPFIAQTPEELPSQAENLAISGLDFMQDMLAGRKSLPPVAGTMNYTIHAVEHGRVAFRGAPEFRHTNPLGGVHGGWYGSLLDTALGCAVMTVVPQGSWYTTLEYKVNITRALPIGTMIEVVGEVLHAGRSTAVATAELRCLDQARLFATGSTTCIILPG
ncbi:PaaI family thioesterase [Rhodobacteraceae bacterium 2376]|uniref:PaaI family thioesterase n=1 Tax=Rhabdonatronobacter sediminivivens TaxID=2743469 RepID=A0A7Z0HYX4_9RHOB|nr:PaaI family thioesterase [Rhabdonatronobacter sediminivivens]NYS24838.1 PaaI family thioesterase [Rhabdonatronobacter sediminivivens]